GKPVLQDLFGRAGVSTDSAVDGAGNATMFSASRAFSDADWSRINFWLDAVHNALAEEPGGMREAIAIARRRAGLPDDAPVRVYPRLGPLDQLRPAESSEVRPAAPSGATSGIRELFTDGWGPAWQFAAAAGLPPYGPLTLPGVWKINLPARCRPGRRVSRWSRSPTDATTWGRRSARSCRCHSPRRWCWCRWSWILIQWRC